MVFVVNDYEITKERPDDLPVCYDKMEWIGIDSDGNFIDNCYYIVVRLTIINNTDVEQDWWLNHFWLYMKDKEDNTMGKSEYGRVIEISDGCIV